MVDYSVSCNSLFYHAHTVFSVLLVMLIPLGIPCYIFYELAKARPAILRNEGPHHLENLYKDYKKECCLWEVYRTLRYTHLSHISHILAHNHEELAAEGLLCCYVWSAEMIQKVFLIGLLTFVSR
eukprot:COSAG05_NODE_5085_length_1268_cov_0.873396_2_plen_125_part_00